MVPPLLPALVVVLVAVFQTVKLVLVVRERHHHRAASISRASSDSPSSSPLEQARRLVPPRITLQQGGEFEGGDFFQEHHSVLQAAWQDWWHTNRDHLPPLLSNDENNENVAMVNPQLSKAIRYVQKHPTTTNEEQQIKSLFTPIIQSHVYSVPLLTRQGIRALRQHLDAASFHYNNHQNDNNTTTPTNSTNETARAGIPTRRPNGMNRFGVIIDADIPGAVSYPELVNWIHSSLIREVMLPLAEMLFPEFACRNHPEDVSESYAFTIRYQAANPKEDAAVNGDSQLSEHSDASLFTMNINLNDDDDDDADDHDNVCEAESSDGNSQQYNHTYTGSSLYFVSPAAGEDVDTNDHGKNDHVHVQFRPGMAVLHRGIIRHATLPITQGERHNLVLWIFGREGYVRIGEYPPQEQLTVKERWTARGPQTREHPPSHFAWMSKGRPYDDGDGNYQLVTESDMNRGADEL